MSAITKAYIFQPSLLPIPRGKLDTSKVQQGRLERKNTDIAIEKTVYEVNFWKSIQNNEYKS